MGEGLWGDGIERAGTPCAEDLFLVWLMDLPLDADPAMAAARLLACAPPPPRDTPIQHRLRALLAETARTARAA